MLVRVSESSSRDAERAVEGLPRRHREASHLQHRGEGHEVAGPRAAEGVNRTTPTEAAPRRHHGLADGPGARGVGGATLPVHWLPLLVTRLSLNRERTDP